MLQTIQDLTMEGTEAFAAAKVTPKAKRYKKLLGDKGTDGTGAATGPGLPAGGSSTSAHSATAATDEPENLPVAAVLRFQQLEQAQKWQGEANELQGKQLVSLET